MRRALLLIAVAGCEVDEDLLGDVRVVLDGERMVVHGGDGEVRADGGATRIALDAISDPLCDAVDDEKTVEVRIRIPDPAAVPLGTPIDVSDPAAPVAVDLAVACFCGVEEVPPEFTLTGTVTLEALADDRAEGRVDVALVGDVPFVGGGVFLPDSDLAVDWTFRAPFAQPTCP